MGNVTSTIYSTTAKEPMTQLDFSTEFEGSKASVTINLVKAGTIVSTETYPLDANNHVAKVSIVASDISTEGTVTLAAKTNAVVFSGVCVWKDSVSFRASNVAVAYR
ncbi:hypothetical protein [uncultured Dokdonia sp.]|uniref:hypothetical protein n=1 Tax=uncultured Dokdonia sp. TaxID=575653 RepID=UPI00260FA5F7|nr:hypothetical protein [uncultured Dokdonia sp.]